MTKSLGTPAGLYRQHVIYDVADDIARGWLAQDVAVESVEPPAHVVQFYARLAHGAGRPCLFLPFVGEFGHQVMTHIRLVNWHMAGEKVVCCRPGEEVLYPSASRYATEWNDPIPDEDRVASVRAFAPTFPELANRFPHHMTIDGHGLTQEQELLAIRPDERIPFRPRLRGLRADVVLGVRARAFCPERNWQHWQLLADALAAAGHSFAVIGHKSTSFDLDGQVCHSGDLDTDAALELLQNCRLYVGNDSGSSHLAATVGAQMMVFRETAWGSRDLVPRMHLVNKGRVRRIRNGWEHPQDVIRHVLEALNTREGSGDV